MNIIELINSQTDIETLKQVALQHLQILYDSMKLESYKAEVYEFILGSMDLSADFEYFENPKVSIVIPVKDKFVMTAALLHSIKRNTQGISLEIIVADDNSTDDTVVIDKIFTNVTRIVNDTGHNGFIYNINNAVNKARGEYILSLNNDMITMPNFLDELLKVMECNKDIGIAGSKTLKTDNTVQECGIKMFKEGIVQFLGENEPQDFMDYEDYLNCDYCSGCAIMFKRSIWEKAGGFDINLAPAYFDDSDFAYKLKYNFGLKSVCVPKSKIFHFRGISYKENPLDDGQYEKNKQYFLNKWGKYIKDSCIL